MRYDSDKNKIIISLSEFVSLARRLISVGVSSDEDEPVLRGIPERVPSSIHRNCYQQ